MSALPAKCAAQQHGSPLRLRRQVHRHRRQRVCNGIIRLRRCIAVCDKPSVPDLSVHEPCLADPKRSFVIELNAMLPPIDDFQYPDLRAALSSRAHSLDHEAPFCEVQTSDSSLHAPGLNLHAPGLGLQAPGLSPHVPRLNLQAPGLQTPCLEAPGLGAPSFQAPGLSLQAPGLSIQAPDLDLECPDVSLQAPGLSLQAPDLDLECPDVSLQAPDLDLEFPDLEPRAPAPGQACLEMKPPGLSLSECALIDERAEIAAATFLKRLAGGTSADLASDDQGVSTCHSVRRRHVRFNLDTSVHEIPPYSEIYGLHPREFVFDQLFNMIPAVGDFGFVGFDSDHSDCESDSCEGSDDEEFGGNDF